VRECRTLVSARGAARKGGPYRNRLHPGPGVWRRSSSEVFVTCRSGLARPAANLAFAGLGHACLQYAGRCPTL
jgi:hypothetical protein